jgi:hypothetical protein
MAKRRQGVDKRGGALGLNGFQHFLSFLIQKSTNLRV